MEHHCIDIYDWDAVVGRFESVLQRITCKEALFTIAVAGWRHHLRRLADSSQELFGRPLEPGRVAELVRSALRDMPAAVSVRVNVFARSGVPVQPVDPDLLVIVAGPETSEPGPPMRVRSIGYERDLAHLKHYDFLGVLWPGMRTQNGLAGATDALCKMHGPRGFGDSAAFNVRRGAWEVKNKAIRLMRDGTPDTTDVGRLWNEGLAFWGWFFYLSKFYEVVDTMIIIAKGKRSSTLQTYHHAGAMFCMLPAHWPSCSVYQDQVFEPHTRLCI